MKKALFILISAFTLSVVVSFAYAQEGEEPAETEGTQEKPTYLEPVSNAADLNLLAGIFGDIARAAAGQIELSEMLLDPSQGTDGAMNTDSVLSAMMYVYLLAMMGLAGFLLLILVAAMAVQAGIEGKVLTQRYNEWAVIRTLYAVFAILPVVGGWSVGQYAVLNGTFYMNSVANDMNTVGNKWLFSRQTTTAINVDPFVYRPIVESIYLNQACAEIANLHTEKMKAKQQAYKAKLEARLDSPLLPDFAADRIQKAMAMVDNALSGNYSDWRMIQRWDVDGEDLKGGARWSADQESGTECGYIAVDYSNFLGDIADGRDSERYNDRTLTAFSQAHLTAIEQVADHVEAQFQEVKNTVAGIRQTVESTGPYVLDSKIRRMNSVRASQTNHQLSSLSFIYDPLATVNASDMKELIDEATGVYVKTVRETYNQQTADMGRLFDDLLEHLARQQDLGGPANYRDAYTDAGVELPARFEPVAGDRVNRLIDLTAQGWMFAGFKWWDLSKATSNQKALEAHHPHYQRFFDSIDEHDSNIRKDLVQFQKTYASVRLSASSETMTIEGVPHAVSPHSEYWLNNVAVNTDEGSEKISADVSQYILRGLFSVIQDVEGTDLIAGLQGAGHKYIVTGELLLAAASKAKLASATAETGGGWLARLGTGGGSKVAGALVSELFAQAASILLKGAYLLVGVGVLYAVYLPLLPAMIWTFSVIGWLEKLITLIIALPAWMIGHIFPDGDGIINGVGRQGYTLAAVVLMRPPVMILSLHFAMAALGAVGFILSHILDVFYVSAMDDHPSFLIPGIAAFIVLSGFIVVLSHMILAWIYKIPDDLPHYIGGSPGSFGEGDAKSHMGGISGMVFHQTEGLSHLSGGGGDPNQKAAKSPKGGGKGKRGLGK